MSTYSQTLSGPFRPPGPSRGRALSSRGTGPGLVPPLEVSILTAVRSVSSFIVGGGYSRIIALLTSDTYRRRLPSHFLAVTMFDVQGLASTRSMTPPCSRRRSLSAIGSRLANQNVCLFGLTDSSIIGRCTKSVSRPGFIRRNETVPATQ